MFKRVSQAIALALLASFTSNANAAIVTPTNSVIISFDTSIFGPNFTIRTAGYNCFTTCSLSGVSPEYFGPNASMQLDLGTTPGGSELASRIYTNQFGTPSRGIAGTIIGPPIPVTGSLSRVFLTLVYVDDVFGVDRALLGVVPFGATTQQSLLSDALMQKPVPLPGALPLFLFGLAALGLSKQRIRKMAQR